jgi:hypothetical protein
MRYVSLGLLCLASVLLTSCTSSYHSETYSYTSKYVERDSLMGSSLTTTRSYESRLPQSISAREKTIIVDPKVHAWGAYGADGNLIRAGLATAGGDWCADIGRPCRTRAGSFRIQSLGSEACKSSLYPRPHGGAHMPYCMFFNGSQGLHGTSDAGMVEANVSHGCVRMYTPDAEWVRFNFANVGTRVVVKSY